MCNPTCETRNPLQQKESKFCCSNEFWRYITRINLLSNIDWLMPSPRPLFILWEIEPFQRLRRLRQLSWLMIKAQQISINCVLLFLMSNGCVRDYWYWKPMYDTRVALKETHIQIYTRVAMRIVAYITRVVKEDSCVCTWFLMDIVVYVNLHIEK